MSLLNHYIYSRAGAIKNNLNGRQAKRKIQRNKQQQQQNNNSDVIKSYFPFPCFIEPRRRMSTTKRGKIIRKVYTERRNEQKTVYVYVGGRMNICMYIWLCVYTNVYIHTYIVKIRKWMDFEMYKNISKDPNALECSLELYFEPLFSFFPSPLHLLHYPTSFIPEAGVI